jgi:hypothetical protein
MRAIAGIVVGLIASLIAAVIVGIFGLGATFSLPPGIDATDQNQVFAILLTIPQSTQLALAGAWFAGAFAGALVAKLISRQAWVAWAVALVVTAYFGINAFALPLPLWVKALWIIGPLIGGLIGNQLVSGGAAPEAATTETEDDAAAATIEAEAPPANP